MSLEFILLILILILFMARVISQVFVGLYSPKFLPPMEEWYSGLLPYPYLLVSQVMIIQLMTLMCYDFWRTDGFFLPSTESSRLNFYYLGLFYFFFMVFRYIMTMCFKPERRWFKGTIPIWFHMLLASFILVWTGNITILQ